MLLTDRSRTQLRAGPLDLRHLATWTLFATALVTRNAHTAFLVGVAAAVGAGIELLSSPGCAFITFECRCSGPRSR